MRQRDINRKMFHTGHYNVIAGRLKNAMEPYMGLDQFDSEQQKRMGMTGLLTAKTALVDLCVSFALRLQADNEDFDPVLFLNSCSPNLEKFPLGAIWDEMRFNEYVEQELVK